MSGLKFHPFANLFPLIEGDEFDAIVADMRATGFRSGEEIVMYEGRILDGRNRYRAGVAAGLFPADVNPKADWRFCDFGIDGIDGIFTQAEIDAGPLKYVIAKNLRRRHLNESQRAYAAAGLANMAQGRPEKPANLPVFDQGCPQSPEDRAAADDAGDRGVAGSEPVTDSERDASSLQLGAPSLPPSPLEGEGREGGDIAPVTQDQAAQMLNVSPRLVRAAKTVQQRAAPELQAAVEQGKLAVSAAAQAAGLDHDTQRKIADAARADQPNAARLVIKQSRRAWREAELGAKQCALPTKKYGLIACDDGWDEAVWSRETGMDRHAANHYQTEVGAYTAAEMHERSKARFECAAPDCLLAMWSTVQHLDIAIDLLRLRGFRYVSHYAWDKEGISLGRWNRCRHEIFLLGVKGHVPCPAPGKQWDSLIRAPRGKHSEKPECFLEMLETYFPNLPKIEFNRRGPPRPGWDGWGNECEQTERQVMPDADRGLEAGPGCDASPPRPSEVVTDAASGGADDTFNNGGENDGDSVRRHGEVHDHGIRGNGDLAPRIPERVHSADTAAGMAQGWEDHRAGNVRCPTTAPGQEGQSASGGQTAGRSAQGAEAPGDPSALNSECADSQANGDGEIADTKQPQPGESAGGVNAAPSRLAGGRTPAPPPFPPPLAGEGREGGHLDPSDEILEMPNFLKRGPDNRPPWLREGQ